jgi:hypothetical protein
MIICSNNPKLSQFNEKNIPSLKNLNFIKGIIFELIQTLKFSLARMIL